MSISKNGKQETASALVEPYFFSGSKKEYGVVIRLPNEGIEDAIFLPFPADIAHRTKDVAHFFQRLIQRAGPVLSKADEDEDVYEDPCDCDFCSFHLEDDDCDTDCGCHECECSCNGDSEEPTLP